MKALSFVLIGIILTTTAYASSFKGYKKSSSGDSLKYTASIQRILETDQDFHILISGYAAFYRFPKTVSYADQVRGYLNTRMKNKKKVVIEIDPRTAEIIFISDPAK